MDASVPPFGGVHSPALPWEDPQAMKRLLTALGLASVAALVSGTLVTVLGTMIGFYDWMWLVVLLACGLAVGYAIISDEHVV